MRSLRLVFARPGRSPIHAISHRETNVGSIRTNTGVYPRKAFNPYEVLGCNMCLSRDPLCSARNLPVLDSFGDVQPGEWADCPNTRPNSESGSRVIMVWGVCRMEKDCSSRTLSETVTHYD